MKKRDLQRIANSAEKSALRLDFFLGGLRDEIRSIRRISKANGDDGAYGAKILETFCSLIGEEIEELFQMKYDINESIDE